MNTAVDRAAQLGDSLYAYNKGLSPYKIRIDIALYGSERPVEVDITRQKGLTREDIAFIMERSAELNGELTFEQRGVVNVKFN